MFARKSELLAEPTGDSPGAAPAFSAKEDISILSLGERRQLPGEGALSLVESAVAIAMII